MKHYYYGDDDVTSYKYCLLVNALDIHSIEKEYFEPVGFDPKETLILTLYQDRTKKKTSASQIRQYIQEELQPIFDDYKIKTLIVADGEYFKVFTKGTKSESQIGYELKSHYGTQSVFYVPNFRSIFYDPESVRSKIKLAMESVKKHSDGTFKPIGSNVLKEYHYPSSTEDIKYHLEELLKKDKPLAVDIETFSLKHYEAGIGTISFSWEQGYGVTFAVDYPDKDNQEVKDLLRDFFCRFNNTLLFHNITFDVNVLIYELFMDHILDTEGLYKGIEVMLKNWECTQIITYLATNTVAGNKLSLKEQAYEFAGDWGQDNIKDIRKIPLKELLEYNSVDTSATWFTYNKNMPIMVRDEQLDIYQNIFKPAAVDIIHMQLTGMPINMERTIEVNSIIEKRVNNALDSIHNNPIVQEYVYHLRMKHVEDRNSKLVNKRITMDCEETKAIQFNPRSSPQLQELLYDKKVGLALPILERTKTKAPATGGDIIGNLVNHTEDPRIIDLLNALKEFKYVDKVFTSFLPAMLDAVKGNDGWHYLFGSFRLGGTISGRLSSSEPNLQNLPASGELAKLIKSCFQAPPEWILVGLDFDSLEDKISAITTNDPNKVKVYTDGYDSHSLAAYYYFPEELGHLPETVRGINSIKDLYPAIRNDSKPVTFAMTYQGTWITLVKNCGFPEPKAKLIEKRYQDLYKVSVDWVRQKLIQASKDGYVTGAFGLRLRTPKLAQTLYGTGNKIPYEAEAEGRSAGNMLGQSWCLLNSRACSEFLSKVRESEYKYDIRPCSQIHDASYYLVREDLGALEFTNNNLVKAVHWQEHLDIHHDGVKISGELSVFYPTWNEEIGIAKYASQQEIYDTLVAATN